MAAGERHPSESLRPLQLDTSHCLPGADQEPMFGKDRARRAEALRSVLGLLPPFSGWCWFPHPRNLQEPQQLRTSRNIRAIARHPHSTEGL